VSHFKKFFSVALIAGAFFNACGLCQADDILSRVARANANAETNAGTNSNTNTGSSSSANPTTNANAKGAGITPRSDVDARLDNLIASRVQKLQIPGYSLGIIHNGKVVFKKGYGTTDFENGSPVTSQTVFGLASLTKTFTALVLLSLVDQGKINLDDRLDKYLDDLVKSWRPITIRQLASMSGGILKALPSEVVWSEQFKLVQEQPLVSTPGSEYLYSNYSYRTLGSVIEKVTGKKYLEVVHETVLDPLSMKATGTQLSALQAFLLALTCNKMVKDLSASCHPTETRPYRSPLECFFRM
jgi:CubicO group peptidase (beta-lactamase class C family)